MNKKSKLRLLFKSLFVQFGAVKTDDGILLLWDEDTELIVGYKVYVEQDNESGETEYVAAPDGVYHSGNTTFTIENGECTKIENNEVAETEAQAETSEENLAEEPEVIVEEPVEEPAEEPEPEVIVEEPEFDAKKAIEDLRAEYDEKLADLEGRMTAMKEQLDALLALPQDENAFEKESKNEQSNKPLFKTKK